MDEAAAPTKRQWTWNFTAKHAANSAQKPRLELKPNLATREREDPWIDDGGKGWGWQTAAGTPAAEVPVKKRTELPMPPSMPHAQLYQDMIEAARRLHAARGSQHPPTQHGPWEVLSETSREAAADAEPQPKKVVLTEGPGAADKSQSSSSEERRGRWWGR